MGNKELHHALTATEKNWMSMWFNQYLQPLFIYFFFQALWLWYCVIETQVDYDSEEPEFGVSLQTFKCWRHTFMVYRTVKVFLVKLFGKSGLSM